MILVAGEALIDLLIEPSGDVRAALGGGPFNAARTIGRLGHPCAFVGRLSADRFGRQLAAALLAADVAIGTPERCEQPTTLAAAELDANGAASYRFYLNDTSATMLRPIDVPTLAGVNALHIGSLALVLEPTATTLLGCVRAAGPDTLVMVDLNARPLAITDSAHYRARLHEFAASAQIVKASTEDLEFLFPGDDPLAGAQRLVDTGVRVVLLTNGGDPVRVVTAIGSRTVAVPVVDVVDTVGAGDAFGAAALVRWLESGRGRSELNELDNAGLDSLADAARFGARVSAMTCTRIGADPPYLADIPAG